MKLFPMLTLSLALASATALAAEPPKPTTKPAATMPPMDHSKMNMQPGQMDHDKMGEGKMDHGMMDMAGKTPAEHRQMVDAAFAAIDTNKDGSLSKAEFAKHHEMMRMKHGK